MEMRTSFTQTLLQVLFVQTINHQERSRRATSLDNSMQEASSSEPLLFSKWNEVYQRQVSRDEGNHERSEQQQQPHLPATHNQVTASLVGRSRAMDGTSFILPELRWRFDAGALIRPNFVANHIFISHTHEDHVSQLPRFITRPTSPTAIDTNNKKKKKKNVPNDSCCVKIYLPMSAVPFVDEYLSCFYAMTENRYDIHQDQDNNDSKNNNSSEDKNVRRPHLGYELISCEPGDIFWINGKNKISYRIEILKCDHRIDCIGYSIWKQEIGRLKPEYQALTKEERTTLFQEAKRKQIPFDTFTYTKTEPLICLLGDTTFQVFEWYSKQLLHATTTSAMTQSQEEGIRVQRDFHGHSVIVVECTYLGLFDDDVVDENNNITTKELQNADKYKHIHWKQIRPIVEQSPHILFVLIHFSLKYNSLQIRQFFQQYTNVHPMLVEEEVQSIWMPHLQKLQQSQQPQDSKRQQEEDWTTSATKRGKLQSPSLPTITTSPPTCGCLLCKTVSDQK